MLFIRRAAIGGPLVALVTLAALAAATWATQPPAAAGAEPGFAGAPSLGSELRYVGRDGATGMSARVDDRFIAQVAEDAARYGLDRREAVPPPPAAGDEPSRLAIESLRVDAPIRRLGRDEFGRLDVPQDDATVGWNPGDSHAPGEGLSTFLAAHYTFAGGPGVFFELSTLAEGDVIAVEMENGGTHRYRVRSTLDYDLDSIDMGALLAGREGTESLVLMTCSGPILGGNFQLRTVVLADRIGTSGGG